MNSIEQQINEQLEWRYAVKKYDTSKKIDESQIQIIKNSIRYSPSSLGLQPYQVLIIEDKEIRKKLKEVAFNQSQITDSSHLFVFCAKTHISEQYIEDMIDGISRARSQEINQLESYKNSLLNSTQSKEFNDLLDWNVKQCYIALGFSLQTASLLKIDATPMEGFKSEEFDQILHLNNMGLRSVVVCCFGYRSEDDKYSKLNKWRKQENQLFNSI